MTFRGSFTLFALIVAAPVCLAEASVTTMNVVLLGSDFVGTPLALDDHTVLEFAGARGVVRDVTDPQAPTLASEFRVTTCLLDHVAYDDGLLIGAQSIVTSGATLLDLRDPGVVDAVYTGFAPYFYDTLTLRGGAAYLCDDTVCFAYDLENPGDPTFGAGLFIGEFDGYRWPATIGDVLYLVDGASRLHAIDVTQPTLPVDLGTLTLPAARIDAMLAVGTTLVVAQEGPAGPELATYGFNGPLTPVTLSVQPAGVSADAAHTSLARAGDLLLLGTRQGGLQAFSFADPAAPRPGAVHPALVAGLAATPGAVFVLEGGSLRTYAWPEYDAPPTLLAVRTQVGRLGDAVMEHGIVVGRTSAEHDLVFIDARDPARPRLLADMLKGPFGEPALNGGRLACCDSASIWLYDVSDPALPRVIAKIRNTMPGSRAACRLDGDRLAVCHGLGIQLYDVSDPAAPRRAAVLATRPGFVSLQGSLLGVWDYAHQEVRLYGIRDLDTPLQIGAVDVDTVADIAVADGRVFIATRSVVGEYVPGGPHGLQPVAHVSVRYPSALMVAGSRLWVQTHRGARIVDIATPGQPAIVGGYDDPSGTEALAASDGLAYTISVEGGGLVIRDDTAWTSAAPDLPRPASWFAPPYPNPFNPATTLAFSLASAGPVRLTVHDLRGRLVATLADGDLPAGAHALTWRGDDAVGRPVASGVYLLRLAADGRTSWQRATLVR